MGKFGPYSPELIQQGLEISTSEVQRAFFGPGTRTAVMEWQRRHGLRVTGIVDERTNASLEVAPQSASVQTQSPAPVTPTAPPAPTAAPAPSAAVTDIFSRQIKEAFAEAREAAEQGTTRPVTVNGTLLYLLRLNSPEIGTRLITARGGGLTSVKVGTWLQTASAFASIAL
jgi:peptidoglycan hydrolase-like protein with peptidoglycan-binding domain